MCGLSFYCHTKQRITQELQASLHAIAHRGPDDRGIFQHNIGNYTIGMGHNRLSILDLSAAGKQPMHAEGVVLAYNGEVYNHQALRIDLEKKGYQLQSQTDTEVVALLYRAFGTAAFGMLRGMFAFILLDEVAQKIFLVRDSIGIKPLYMFHDENGLYASSEIRGLKAFSAVSTELDRNDIFEFFNQGFLYEPSTGYAHIKKLMPGTYLEFDLTQSTSAFVKYQVMSTEISDDLEATFQHAVEQQCIADVPLSVFFSGGTDSSLIAEFSTNESLLFAQFDEEPATRHDKIFSKKIASFLNKPLQVLSLLSQDQTPQALLKTVDFVARNSEELISDYTFWATYQLASAARHQGYKVLLSGMGGDEIFAGYPRYWVLKHHALIKLCAPILQFCQKYKLFPKRFEKKFERLVSYSQERHWPTAYARLLGYFSREDLSAFFADAAILGEQYQHTLNQIANRYEGDHRDKVKWAQHCDLLGFLSHNLMVSDKASMLASIELRVPLLDEAIVKYGISLPSKKLLKKRTLKYPLKALLQKRLPKKLIERPKVGFNPPLDGLISQLGKANLQQAFQFASDLINIERAMLLLDEHFSGKANHTYKLWQLLYFSRWLKVNEFSRREIYAEATS